VVGKQDQYCVCVGVCVGVSTRVLQTVATYLRFLTLIRPHKTEQWLSSKRVRLPPSHNAAATTNQVPLEISLSLSLHAQPKGQVQTQVRVQSETFLITGRRGL
jgi:hypothetical protein